jgi:hypothetical protein
MRSGIFFTRRVDDPNRVEAIQEISFEGWQQVAGSLIRAVDQLRGRSSTPAGPSSTFDCELEQPNSRKKSPAIVGRAIVQ